MPQVMMPRTRQGRFSTELFERYPQKKKAVVAALMEMYGQGVSTRRAKAFTEELCGHEISARAVSAINRKLDAELTRFMTRRLEVEYLYVILDARYERVREDGVGQRRAVLITSGIGWDGRRNVLSVELANRESATSWKDHLLALQAARPARCALRGERRPPRIEPRGDGDLVGGLVVALLRALPAQRARPPPAQARRQLPEELRWLYDLHERRRPAAIPASGGMQFWIKSSRLFQ